MSGCYSVLGGEGVEGVLVADCGLVESAVVGGVELFGEAAGQDPVVDAGEQHRGVEAVVGDGVAVSPWDAFDQAVAAEAAEVVGRLARRDSAG